MKYMGSKNRIAKHLLPIMLAECEKHGITKWVEPFVGGANMIDKVPSHYERVGYDLNPHTIAALIGVRDHLKDFPNYVTKDFYKSTIGSAPHYITSLIRFELAFGSVFESTFTVDDKRKGRKNRTEQARLGLMKQSPKIQNVQFICDSYENLDFENCLVYCDPPYANTSGYKTGSFDHDNFFDWCREQAKKNIVFVSEYNAPDDFIEVWRGEIKTNFASTRKKATHNAVEKLFIIKNPA